MTEPNLTEEGRHYRVAIVGATGAVGSALLSVLEERQFPVGALHLLGREGDDDEPQTAVYANRGHRISAVAEFDFSRADLVFSCAPAPVSSVEVPRAVGAGCRVVDCSAAFRLQADVPLVVAGVNDTAVAGTLAASPSAAAVQAAAILGPIGRSAGLARVSVHTQLAVSSLGKAAVAELAGQTARILNVQALKEGLFPAQIAFNTLSLFDVAGSGGYTEEERTFAAEIRCVLADHVLPIYAAFTYVPVFYGHTQVLEIQTLRPLTATAIRSLLAEAEGVELLDDDAGHLSPVGDNAGGDAVVVGRVRVDPDSGLLTIWSVADNVRKGAAVNSARIAETLLKAHP